MIRLRQLRQKRGAGDARSREFAHSKCMRGPGSAPQAPRKTFSVYILTAVHTSCLPHPKQFAELEAWAGRDRSRWEPGLVGVGRDGVDRGWAQTIQPLTRWMGKLASRGQRQKPEKEEKNTVRTKRKEQKIGFLFKSKKPLGRHQALIMVASAGLSQQTTGHMWPRTAANATQHKIVAVLESL